MKSTSILSLTVLFGLLSISCSKMDNVSGETVTDKTANFDTASLKKIIDNKNNQFTQAHITGDTSFLNNIFTRDARVLAPNSKIVTGRSAIALVNLAYINFGITEFREETTALYGNGDYLINEGTYFMKYGANNIIDKGKFINIWKKIDGDWRLYSNIWNTDIPIPSEKE